MPIVKIEILKGQSLAYRKAVLDGVHNALVSAIKIPDDDRRQRLYEFEQENFEKIGRSDLYTIIEVTMFKGRSFEAKKKLYADIVNNLAENPGIPGNDVTIIIHEVPLDNWGIRGGKPASEVNLGFDISV